MEKHMRKRQSYVEVNRISSILRDDGCNCNDIAQASDQVEFIRFSLKQQAYKVVLE
jgi:hypothetical protein